MFTMCLFTVGSQGLITARIAKKRFLQYWDQRNKHCHINSAITHKDLQVELEQLYLKIDFPFDRQLASMATLIYVCMTYSSTMPLMNIICFISLFFLYLINKIYILRYHKLPSAYSVALPKIITKLLYGAGLLHALLGAWMFGNSNFYAPNFHRKETLIPSTMSTNTSFLQQYHSWNEAVSWTHRATGQYSIALLGVSIILLLVILAVFAGGFIRYLFGLKSFDEWLDKLERQRNIKKRDRSNSWMMFRNMESKLPPYFECLPISLLHQRLNSGVIAGRLHEKYKVYSLYS